MLKSRTAILVAASLLQAVFWLAVLRADPFGMSSAADRVSEGIFLRLYPILYPGDTRKQIQVVMIDERQLPLPIDGARNEWPIGFEEHVALIERVLSFQPKAVFVDFLFDTENGRDPKAFAELVARLESRDGPPLVFAAYRDPKQQARVIEPLRELKGRRVIAGTVEVEEPINHYPLSDGSGRLSAAAVLYNATLNSRSAPKAGGGAASNMLVAWGNTVTREDARFTECAAIIDEPASRWNGLIAAVMTGLQGAFDSKAVQGPKTWERQQPCAYHSETRARDLFEGDDKALSRRFKDAYVLIGASIAGSGDVTVSPVHGQLPGVHLHAMALDNLLTFQGRPLGGGSEWALGMQALLVFMCTLAGGYFFAERPAPSTRVGAAQTLFVRLLVWGAFAAVAAAMLLMFLVQFNLVPYNWGSVLAIASVVFFAGSGRAILTLVRGEL